MAAVKIGDEMDMSQQTEVKLTPELEKNEYPSIPAESKDSLWAKYCPKDLWEKLKGLKTKNGFTMARAINSGAKNPRSLVGCHAGDLESYSLFAPFFDAVIDDYHGGYKADAKHPTDMNPANLKGDIEDKSPIISTRIRVARNIEGFQLAPGMNSKDEKVEIESLMKKVFAQLPDDLKGEYHPLLGLPEEKRMEFVTDHFLFKGNDKMQADSGYHRWWPYGRGIYLSKDKQFMVWVNEGDHLRIISMEKGGDVNSVFKRLCRAANVMEELVKKELGRGWMRTDHLGMVTCCPSNLGTGLRGGVLIKVPKLGKDEANLKKICAEHKLQARGLYGEHSESAEGIFDISNKFRLGYSEVQLVQFMVDGINIVNKLEKAA